MKIFIVNKTGDHEIHVPNCNYLPHPSNQISVQAKNPLEVMQNN